VFYARGVTNALQCRSKKAATKFSEFSKLAGIWYDLKLNKPWRLHWWNKSHEKLWKMVNSAMQLEVKARQRSRAIHQLERQVLVSERWIAQLKPLLSETSLVKEELRILKGISKVQVRRVRWGYTEEELRVRKAIPRVQVRPVQWNITEKEPGLRKVIPRLRSKPIYPKTPFSRGSSWPYENGVNENTSADKAWDLLNRNRPVQRHTGNNDRQTLTKANRILADQVAKLLDGFQP
jgi:hypothetical protein